MKSGILRLHVSRGGDVDEAISFLQELLAAYESLLLLDLTIQMSYDSASDEDSPVSNAGQIKKKTMRTTQIRFYSDCSNKKG